MSARSHGSIDPIAEEGTGVSRSPDEKVERSIRDADGQPLPPVEAQEILFDSVAEDDAAVAASQLVARKDAKRQRRKERVGGPCSKGRRIAVAVSERFPPLRR